MIRLPMRENGACAWALLARWTEDSLETSVGATSNRSAAMQAPIRSAGAQVYDPYETTVLRQIPSPHNFVHNQTAAFPF